MGVLLSRDVGWAEEKYLLLRSVRHAALISETPLAVELRPPPFEGLNQRVLPVSLVRDEDRCRSLALCAAVLVTGEVETRGWRARVH